MSGHCKDCQYFKYRGTAGGHVHGVCLNPEIMISDSLEANPSVSPSFGCIQFEQRPAPPPLRNDFPELSTDHVAGTYGGLSRSGPVYAPFGSRKP